MHLRNVFNLEWLQVDNQEKAIWFYMPSSNIYEGSMNMTVDYAGQKDRVLQIELVQVYHVPRVDTSQTDYYTAEFHSLQSERLAAIQLTYCLDYACYRCE